MTDNVNHPSHYERYRASFEPADLTALLPHPLASAIEYILRAPYKGQELEDLQKALWWLKKLRDTSVLWTSYKDALGVERRFLSLPYTTHYAEHLIGAYYALCTKSQILSVLRLNGTTNIFEDNVLALEQAVRKRASALEASKRGEKPSADTALQAGGTE